MTDIRWKGPDAFREYLVPIEQLELPASSDVGDLDRVADGLAAFGQRRPVLLERDRVVGRAHIVAAAFRLGWTHIAARLELAADIAPDDQMSLVDEVVRTNGHDTDALRALVRERPAEADDDEIDDLNEQSASPHAEWVGLPEFVPVGARYKLVVSCETSDDRDALLDLIGISTIHKSTRGTLSVWWPERGKEDLASLRFQTVGGGDA